MRQKLFRVLLFSSGLVLFCLACCESADPSPAGLLCLAAVYTLNWLLARTLLRLTRPLPPGKRLLRALGLGLGWALGLGALIWVLDGLLVLSEDEALLIGGAHLCACLLMRLFSSRRTRKKRPSTVPAAVFPEAPRPRNARRRRARVLPACAALLLAVCLAVLAHWRSAERIPESLLAFREKYPEAAQFVDDYPRAHNRHTAVDLSGEVTQGVVPLFIQWDERWGYEDYGGSFFATNGCGPTSLSMVVCALTGDASVTPLSVARYCEEQGYYTPGSGTSWQLMTQGAQHYGLSSEQGVVSCEYLTEQLSSGRVLIASMKPGDFTYTGHFLVLAGLDEAGRVRVNDSNSPLHSAVSWDVQTLVDQMKGVWSFEAAG